MKKAIVLFELIISVLILSMVTLFTLQFYKQLHDVNHNTFEEQHQTIDMQSSKLFLDHLFANAVQVQRVASGITFFEKETQGFLQGYYSGIVDLESSSKVKLHTPQSSIHQLKEIYAVYFNEHYWYEVMPSKESEYIYFKHPNEAKTVFQHYTLIKRNSTLLYKDHALFYNNHLLLDALEHFDFSLQNHLLTLNVCQDSRCFQWRFQL